MKGSLPQARAITATLDEVQCAVSVFTPLAFQSAILTSEESFDLFIFYITVSIMESYLTQLPQLQTALDLLAAGNDIAPNKLGATFPADLVGELLHSVQVVGGIDRAVSHLRMRMAKATNHLATNRALTSDTQQKVHRAVCSLLQVPRKPDRSRIWSGELPSTQDLIQVGNELGITITADEAQRLLNGLEQRSKIRNKGLLTQRTADAYCKRFRSSADKGSWNDAFLIPQAVWNEVFTQANITISDPKKNPILSAAKVVHGRLQTGERIDRDGLVTLFSNDPPWIPGVMISDGTDAILFWSAKKLVTDSDIDRRAKAIGETLSEEKDSSRVRKRIDVEKGEWVTQVKVDKAISGVCSAISRATEISNEARKLRAA
jgi:hypothetical protein